MTTMDTLWKTASGGKFGYSVQKELWMFNFKRWGKFFKQIDWVQVRTCHVHCVPKHQAPAVLGMVSKARDGMIFTA